MGNPAAGRRDLRTQTWVCDGGARAIEVKNDRGRCRQAVTAARGRSDRDVVACGSANHVTPTERLVWAETSDRSRSPTTSVDRADLRMRFFRSPRTPPWVKEKHSDSARFTRYPRDLSTGRVNGAGAR